jgi:hypothetical protein
MLPSELWGLIRYEKVEPSSYWDLLTVLVSEMNERLALLGSGTRVAVNTSYEFARPVLILDTSHLDNPFAPHNGDWVTDIPCVLADLDHEVYNATE